MGSTEPPAPQSSPGTSDPTAGTHRPHNHPSNGERSPLGDAPASDSPAPEVSSWHRSQPRSTPGSPPTSPLPQRPGSECSAGAPAASRRTVGRAGARWAASRTGCRSRALQGAAGTCHHHAVPARPHTVPPGSAGTAVTQRCAATFGDTPPIPSLRTAPCRAPKRPHPRELTQASAQLVALADVGEAQDLPPLLAPAFALAAATCGWMGGRGGDAGGHRHHFGVFPSSRCCCALETRGTRSPVALTLSKSRAKSKFTWENQNFGLHQGHGEGTLTPGTGL